ncbi:S9 family peptidase [Pseudomarimonas arenosa]|uniref:S9 family peptidase n=1 Tax=Pseudomarimonas arenosa TaxID=2774145 RepID=A0AAW3ZVJ5_9GAMM|nr:S9 family peptidase [Pseudomarimonas arenosa]MBD8528056.1 S9 family peptidase [Pseudomarimonas arenosa]
MGLSAPSSIQARAAQELDWRAELDQIMAHPDWIGPSVEAPFWSLDGGQLIYQLKRNGSGVRDYWQVDLAEGKPGKLADEALAELDGPSPVYDSVGERAAFVRNGDIFVRNLVSGALQQLTRTASAESAPQFSLDGRWLSWRQGSSWERHDFQRGLTEPLVELKAEKDPASKALDPLAEMQLRLIETLAREKQDRETRHAREQELRAADGSRAAAPIYLGEGIEIISISLSPNTQFALVVTEPKGADKGRAGKMPKYVTESGYEEFEDVRTRVGRNPPLGQGLKWVNLSSGEVIELALDGLPGIAQDPLAELRAAAKQEPLKGPRPLRVDDIVWNRQGDRAALMLRAVDNKDRWIASSAISQPALAARHRLTDPAWINWNFNDYGWLPDGRTLWYLSEETGYSHLYRVEDRDRAKPKALTRGRWEASSVRWTREGETAYFICNRDWPGDYEVCSASVDGGRVSEVTALDGVEDFVLSPNEQRLALRASAHHTPPQLVLHDIAADQSRWLTDTRSEQFKARSWQAPEYVQVPSKHGAGKIWGKLYRPTAMEPGKRYPIALFVHGAGYLQNVFARWPNYFREQMFNELLVKQGYVVLDLDYRASEGYGRDWRTAIYRQMGHPELEDYLDGIDYLVKEHQGDRSRVGIYGGSYGGFMAFMALFRAPDAFHAGAALRPVTDWTMYNHEYTSNILNTPQLDPEAYRKSSPIEYADQLKGQLLIAHGMIDDNVFYQDSVRLAQRLIELKKGGWELASYPLERHGYVQPESWYDQYRRIFELFERTLAPR